MPMPMPVPQIITPRSAPPSLIARASFRHVRVVDGIGVVRPEVDRRDAALVEHGLESVLQLEAGVIGDERDDGIGHGDVRSEGVRLMHRRSHAFAQRARRPLAPAWGHDILQDQWRED